jgi:hypothetical protein
VALDEKVTVVAAAGDAALRVDMARDVDHADVLMFEPASSAVPVAFPQQMVDWN